MPVLKFVTRYLLNILIVLDIALNVIVLFGSPFEDISSRAGKAMLAKKRWGCVLCRWLDKIQKDHCLLSIKAVPGDDAIIPDDVPRS